MSAYDYLRHQFPDLAKQPGAKFIECHEGWYEPIHFAFQVFEKASEHGEVSIAQIKEKFGTLRVYAKTPRALKHRRLLDIVLEIESMNTCDLCGMPGELNRGFGWIATRCKEHTGYRGRFDYKIPPEVSSVIPSFERDLLWIEAKGEESIKLAKYKLPEMLFKDPSEFELIESVILNRQHNDMIKSAISESAQDDFTVVEYADMEVYNAIFKQPL